MKLVDRPAFEGFLKLLAVIGLSGLGLWLLVAALGLVFRRRVRGPERRVSRSWSRSSCWSSRASCNPELRRWPYRHLSAAARLGLDDQD
jgi:hypothetical protein